MILIIREKDEIEVLDIEEIAENWNLGENEEELPIIQRIILHLFKRNMVQDALISAQKAKINEIIEWAQQQGFTGDLL